MTNTLGKNRNVHQLDILSAKKIQEPGIIINSSSCIKFINES